MNKKTKKLITSAAFFIAGMGFTSTVAQALPQKIIWQWVSIVTGISLLGIGTALYREEKRRVPEQQVEHQEDNTPFMRYGL